MSYALVEMEIDNLREAFLALRTKYPDEVEAADYALENFFLSIQRGLETHIEECRGVAEALRNAREALAK